MEPKKIQDLTREFIRFKCTQCTRFKIPADGKPGCEDGFDPKTCGRNFNPRGGDLVTA